jgi:hypothetical protein
VVTRECFSLYSTRDRQIYENIFVNSDRGVRYGAIKFCVARLDTTASYVVVGPNIIERQDQRSQASTGRLDESHSTIVTVYFHMPSEHSQDRYINWMENMLSLQDPMVIITQPNFVDQISEFRSHATNRTVIVPLSLKNLPFGTLFRLPFERIN